jgi:hypothetical protein
MKEGYKEKLSMVRRCYCLYNARSVTGYIWGADISWRLYTKIIKLPRIKPECCFLTYMVYNFCFFN